MNFLAAQAKAAGEVPSAALASGLAIGSLLGALLLITGLCFYAKAKGYTPVLGLLGLLSCLGLLILAVLPDKTKGLNEDAG